MITKTLTPSTAHIMPTGLAGLSDVESSTSAHIMPTGLAGSSNPGLAGPSDAENA